MTCKDLIRVYDKERLAQNVQKAQRSTSASIGAVIKADAYGFGIARALPVFLSCGIDHFFAQDLGEAILARKLAKHAKIYTFAGVQDGQEGDLIRHDITPICVSVHQLRLWACSAGGRPCGVHFDTGMNRTGLSCGEESSLAIRNLISKANPSIYISHLATVSLDAAERQRLRFLNCVDGLMPKASLSLIAGNGLSLPPRFHFDIVRAGEILYAGTCSAYAKILQIRPVGQGEEVGYFGSYRASRAMNIAILNIGYKDGYPRGLSRTNTLYDKIRAAFKSGAGFAKAYAMIGPNKCPVVGIITMNNVAIDVSDVPHAELKRAKYAKIFDTGMMREFRAANGFIPVEMIELFRPNPFAVDFSAEEFSKARAAMSL
jgi:alanine racemase